MNIKQAKEEIRHTVRAYLEKDDAGEYNIPVMRQRPLLLMGPPGIGKTQVMEQVARECRIGLVSYTMTHHTRQSAAGLPLIKEKMFGGKTYSVTEYAMSEIIASVYRKMEETGLKEGILFLDEINCVSETLAPAMLQFLQCKTFGSQAVPEGWIIAAAGNPPEYNKSVREFDMATLDRVRMIFVEADYAVWREYARNHGVHGALLSYLDLRPKNFYRAEADLDGIQYVTARGWEDFSYLLRSYEAAGLDVSEEIAYEYLHHKDVAEDAAAYIDLYRKYKDDYGIFEILSGNARPDVFARISAAGFDERLCVTGLLTDALAVFFRNAFLEKGLTDEYFAFLKSCRREGEGFLQEYGRRFSEREEAMKQAARGGFFEKEEGRKEKRLLELLREGRPGGQAQGDDEAFEAAKACFQEQERRLAQSEEEAGAALEHAFDFMEEAFGPGEEMVVFVTELSVSREAAAFLAEHGCERYFQYHEKLLIGSRKRELLSEIQRARA